MYCTPPGRSYLIRHSCVLHPSRQVDGELWAVEDMHWAGPVGQYLHVVQVEEAEVNLNATEAPTTLLPPPSSPLSDDDDDLVPDTALPQRSIVPPSPVPPPRNSRVRKLAHDTQHMGASYTYTVVLLRLATRK